MTTLNTSIDYLRTPTTTDKTATTSSTTDSSKSLGMDSFLKLLTTQMQTQDPFNPVDNTQMLAQMAQFSSVAGISSMNSTLSGIASSLDGNRIGDAASWIGKSVLVKNGSASALSNGAYAGQITLPADATDVTLSLTDASGREVHKETLGAQTKGDLSFAWDGKDASGAAVTGPLTVTVTATGAAGAIKPTISTWTDVTGVQSPAGGTSAKLITGLGLIAPGDALSLA